MPRLVPLEPLSTAKPQIVVENPLRPGRHRFRLVVVDDSRNESAPAEIVVEVVEQSTNPTLRTDILTDAVLRDRIVLNPLRGGVIR